MVVSRTLQKRIKDDAASPAFLSVPKGKAVSEDNWQLIADMLRVLDEYRKMPWSEAQPLFVRRLLDEELIEPYKDHKKGFSGVGRMQLPVWRLLGLAWVNEGNIPEVTEVGRKFIDAKSKVRRALLSMQAHRYQFYNPTNSKHFNEFNTFPLLSLYKVLQNTNWRMSKQEFLLFGSRVKNQSDATEVSNHIEDWRECSTTQQENLISVASTLSAKSHTKSETGTTYAKVVGNWGYARHFLNLSEYLDVSSDEISIPVDQRRKVRQIIDASHEAECIDYRSAQDWLAIYGEVPTKNSWETPWTTAADAKDYYERIGRIDAAAAALGRENKRITKARIEEYRKVQILERVLEDILEHNLEELEPGLTLVGRQFSTAVGPIDLLAQDENGQYVVIELKRGRTSDRVVGQVARYLSWVTERMVQGDDDRARAIVVGREYDKHFSAAITQLSRVKPYTYDIRARFDEWVN